MNPFLEAIHEVSGRLDGMMLWLTGLTVAVIYLTVGSLRR